MALPAVYVAGVWALRGIQAYRAYRAAQLAAQVATAGAAVVGIDAGIDAAQDKARERTAVTTDYCASCQDPKCRDQGEKIKKRRDELQKRYDDMREDPKNLYRDYYDTPHPDPGVGSWLGHVKQFQDKQANPGS